MEKLKDVTRVEVISSEGNGRLLVKYDLKDVKLSIQDRGRTLKIFVSDKPAPEEKEE